MIKKFLVGVVAVGLLVWTYAWMNREFKNRLEASLSGSLGEKVTVQSVGLAFPPGILLTGARISPAAALGQAAVRLNLLAVMQRQPPLDLEISGATFHLPLSQWSRMKAGLQKGLFPVGRLRLRDGAVTLLDEGVSPPVTWNFRDVRISLRYGPRPREYSFGCAGTIDDLSRQTVGSLEAHGEFFLDGVTEAKITLAHKQMEGLSSYVRPVLGAAPKKGAVALESDLTLQQGILIASTELTASGVKFSSDEPTTLGPSGNKLVELLQDSQGNVHLNFLVKGRLSAGLDWSDLVRSGLQEAMRQALARGIHRVLTDTEVRKPVEELIQKGKESLGR